jgi:PAS domain S-box-containing protein
MTHSLRQALAAPVFEDEDKTRIAQLLHVILLSTIAVNLLYSASLLLTIPDPALNLGVDAALLILQVSSFYLMRRGRVRLASIILVGAMWLYCNFVILVFGGTQSPGIIIYFLVILIAGLLLGGRAAVTLSAISVFAGIGLLYAELGGLLPPSLIPITPVYTWIALIMGIVIMAVLLNLATRSLNDALTYARQNASALAEKNEELEAMQAMLEQRVKEQKEAETALRHSEERLLTVVNNAPVILWGVDQDGTLVFLEGKTLHEIGFKPEDFIGSSVFDITDERVPQLAAQFRRAMRGETFTTVERMRGRIFEMRYAPMLDADDTAVGIIGIAIDITERRQAEEALFQAQKLESLGILAGGIAHDFNNLLVAMLGQTSLAQRKLSSEHPAREHIYKAVDAAQKAAALTKQMLAYSGRGQFEVVPINLNALIDENIHLFKASIPKNVQLHARLSPKLPSIVGDPAQMQQVIMNLILNAADAIGSNPGTVTVVTGVEELTGDEDGQWRWSGNRTPNGRFVAVEIHDDGRGMDEKTLAKIFDPFFSTKASGQGLGLAAVLGIVQGHRGSVQVKSQPNEGTVFKVLLPVSSKEPVPTSPKEGVHRAPDGDEHLVLVIDDEESVRAAVSDILEMEGIDVLTAPDGQTGVDLFSEHAHDVDLVLLDLSMPGLSGQETLDLLREYDSVVPVVLSSGYDKQDVGYQFDAKELTGFMQKPYTAQGLIDTVWKYLGDSE